MIRLYSMSLLDVHVNDLSNIDGIKFCGNHSVRFEWHSPCAKDSRMPGVYGEVRLQDLVEIFALCVDARNDLIHLRSNSECMTGLVV